jgi:trypsin
VTSFQFQLLDELPSGNTTNSIDIALQVPFEGHIARISGWGSTSSGAWLSSHIIEKDVIIVYFNDCKYLYEGIRDPVTERMFCAVGIGGGPCQGDSGDPMVFNGQLIGLMSWSFGCGDSQYPAVYTDVTRFKGWIADHTGLSV